MPTKTDPRLRVVIVNYRSIDDVATRLRSEALRDAHVIVVDNASDPDRVVELCDEHGATPILLPKNRGFAAGVNVGWEMVRDLPRLPLLLLNPDADLSRDALECLLAALPGHDGVGPLLLEGPNRPQVGVGGGRLSLPSIAAYFLMLSHAIPTWQGVFLTRAQARRGGHVAWLCMAALLLAPDALDHYGPLPEEELVYAEDVAWGTVATLHGARFEIVPSAVVGHDHGSSGSSEAWVGALERLIRRRLNRVTGLSAVLVVRLGLCIRRLAGRSWRSPRR